LEGEKKMLIASREMSNGHRGFKGRVVGLAVLMLLSATANGLLSQEAETSEAPAQNFFVTSTSNSGAGTLRQAIMDANASPGLDNITFNISGSGIQTITINSVLPTITDPLFIDGNSQPGYSGTPLILIHGSGTSEAMNITAGGTTLRGLTFGHFNGSTSNGAVHFATAGGNTVIEGRGFLDHTHPDAQGDHTGGVD
jgi:hypothetical protein